MSTNSSVKKQIYAISQMPTVDLLAFDEDETVWVRPGDEKDQFDSAVKEYNEQARRDGAESIDVVCSFYDRSRRKYACHRRSDTSLLTRPTKKVELPGLITDIKGSQRKLNKPSLALEFDKLLRDAMSGKKMTVEIGLDWVKDDETSLFVSSVKEVEVDHIEFEPHLRVFPARDAKSGVVEYPYGLKVEEVNVAGLFSITKKDGKLLVKHVLSRDSWKKSLSQNGKYEVDDKLIKELRDNFIAKVRDANRSRDYVTRGGDLKQSLVAVYQMMGDINTSTNAVVNKEPE